MSVKVTGHGETKLYVFTKTIDLMKYTIDLCSNAKVFPQRKKWALPNELYKAVNMMCLSIFRANHIKVEDKATAMARLEHSRKAFESANDYETLMNITCDAYRNEIGVHRMDYWVPLAMESITLIEKWYKAETLRYKEYIDI